MQAAGWPGEGAWWPGTGPRLAPGKGLAWVSALAEGPGCRAVAIARVLLLLLLL